MNDLFDDPYDSPGYYQKGSALERQDTCASTYTSYVFTKTQQPVPSL